jgi:hypothetical protein
MDNDKVSIPQEELEALEDFSITCTDVLIDAHKDPDKDGLSDEELQEVVDLMDEEQKQNLRQLMKSVLAKLN